MKKIILLFIALTGFVACSQPATETSKEEMKAANITLKDNQKAFGTPISPDGAITLAQLPSKMKGAKEMQVKLKGEVEAVCKKKGCWMRLKQDEKDGMLVTFKDYGFFVPLDCDGKTAIIEGTAKLDTTDVATLQHFAEDEGLSEEEIAAITEPAIEVVFIADGAIIEE